MHKYDNQLEDFFGMSSGNGSSDRESIKDSLARKLPLRSRLRLLPKVLSRNERYVMVALALIFLGSLASLPITIYRHYTVAVPANGGSVTEGLLGSPRLINPLLAQTSDADRDLSALIFSGLYRYNGLGKLVPDLAETLPETTTDGLSYSVTLREGAVWHDGTPVTADDVVFSIAIAQNSDYGVPMTIRANWQGVTVEKISDRVIIFHLKNKYAQFPHNLTLGILPKHLWGDVRPSNFSLSELNLKPIGSGPYEYSSLVKDDTGRITRYRLKAFDDFYAGRPHIDSFEFRFYGTEEQIIDAFNKQEIDNFSNIAGINLDKIKYPRRVAVQPLKMPRYYALFFNQNQSKPLSDKNVRLALNYATDRVAIINKVMDGNAFLIDSPMLGGVLDINPNVRSYDYDLEKAKSVLKAGGWTMNSDGVLAKGKDTLELKITTSSWSELAAVAAELKTQWEKLGVKVTIDSMPISQLQPIIKDRNYQSILFGEIMTIDPDPFTTWHSSQRQDLGLNLALYKNDTADRLIEEARSTLNPLERMQKYDDFQKILLEDIPAIFLYSPDFLYGIDSDIKGFTTKLIGVPESRFTDVVNWYIDTERNFK